MKIFCIGRNYVDHVKELSNNIPDAPVIFMKPDTALLKDGEPFYHPSFSTDIHHEIELVIRINRVGKKIQQEFAYKYYNEIGLGIDFTARDIQTIQKQKGLPWEIAKGFDGSAPIGKFLTLENIKDVKNINFSLQKNSEIVQQGHSNLMIYSFDYIIHYLSQYFTLRVGDLIYTGTPAGVSKVSIGDVLEGFIEGEKMLHCEVK
ncbi:MAG: fumarylacetoacetate hydrolase family protein [Bacteroidetes bacterium]|nr:fumarylacetoacetate hydrolase family protein [Bacteroidota bacterium]